MELIRLIDFCDEPKHNDSVELSVIITSRAENWPILSMTLQSIQEECIASTKHLGENAWEVIVVFNSDDGEDTEGEESFKKSHYRLYGNFRYCHTNVLSSSVARSAGVYKAVGRYVYIGDSHMIIGRDCFKYLMETHAKLIANRIPVGILHSALGWMSGTHSRDLCDQYTPKLLDKFWGNWSKSGIKEPHKICMKGTSFLMLRDFAIDIGLWNLYFKPYGGNESYINIKTWRLGYEVYVDPRAYVWHLAYRRNYSWTNDILWFNQMLSAYTIGGDKWLDNQEGNYQRTLEERHKEDTLVRYSARVSEMRNEVVAKGTDDKVWIDARAKFTLDELMKLHGWK